MHTMDNASVASLSSSLSSNETDWDMSSATSTSELLSPKEHERAMLDRLTEYFLTCTVHMNGKTNGEQVGVPTGMATPSSTSTSSTQAGSPPAGQASGSAKRSGDCGVAKGKRVPADREPNDEGSGSDREEDGRPSSKRQKSREIEQRRLACPFFKRNPQRYKEKRSCVAPGFRTVHRLKQVTSSFLMKICQNTFLLHTTLMLSNPEPRGIPC